MSRAYRITLAESIRREIVAADEIASHLEILPVLPAEATAALLRDELIRRGFEEASDGQMTRTDDAATITILPTTGEVRIRVAKTVEGVAEASRDVIVWDDIPTGGATAEATQAQLKKDLEARLDRQTDSLTAEATAALECALAEWQPELAAIAGKITRDALKIKAKSLGTITSLTEDDAAGSLTLTIEV
jgi:hypothetical protein